MIDIQIGINNCGGYEEDYASILEFVIEDSQERMESLDSYYKNEDYDNYVICVHAMKSTLASVGAMDASKLARSLEMAGKEGRTEYIVRNHPEMMKCYRDTMDAAGQILSSGFADFCKKDDGAEQTAPDFEESITLEEVKEYLKNVTVLIEQFQYDDAEEVLRGILEFSMEEPVREELDDILKDVTMFRMEKALKRIKEIS